MNLDIVIVHTFIWSDGIYMRPDGPNTLIHQSANINDAPREPPYRPHYRPPFTLFKFLGMYIGFKDGMFSH